jgi:hypothetical protein
MSANLKLLSIKDLKMLLRIQREKAVREAEAKRLAVKVVILYERSSCHKIPELDQMYGLS